jgi:hypothetical protein
LGIFEILRHQTIIEEEAKALLCCVVVFSFVETGLLVLLLLLLQLPPSSSCQLWGCYPKKKRILKSCKLEQGSLLF